MKRKRPNRSLPYAVCPVCGAHIDHGERCDCTAAEGATLQPRSESKEGEPERKPRPYKRFYHRRITK